MDETTTDAKFCRCIRQWLRRRQRTGHIGKFGYTLHATARTQGFAAGLISIGERQPKFRVKNLIFRLQSEPNVSIMFG